MVAWLLDQSGQFPRRPHYAPGELDRAAETLVGSFLLELRGAISYPLTTADLSLLVERYASDLDQYADLSAKGEDVEGMTQFLPNTLPEVSISAVLASDPRRENRLRTTLAHELGHAYFHRQLYDERFAAGQLIELRSPATRTISKRAAILGASKVDWMEWQAGYVSGAVLMPRTPLIRLASDLCASEDVHTAVHVDAPLAGELEGRVAEGFQVSLEAARVRLLKLGLLTTSQRPPALFG